MASKSKLVLFDTGIIIQAFKHRLWDALVSRYQIITSEIVVSEAIFYTGDDGCDYPIDLEPYIKRGDIRVEDVPLSDLAAFKNKYDPVYCEQLDPGELSLLCLLFKAGYEEALISSGDAIVYRILGRHLLSEKGISLEELIKKIGINKKLPDQFCDKFKREYSRKGFTERPA